MAGYSYAPQQYYYTTPEVQHASISYISTDYFASTINFHVDVVSHNSGIHIASHNSTSQPALIIETKRQQFDTLPLIS